MCSVLRGEVIRDRPERLRLFRVILLDESDVLSYFPCESSLIQPRSQQKQERSVRGDVRDARQYKVAAWKQSCFGGFTVQDELQLAAVVLISDSVAE